MPTVLVYDPVKTELSLIRDQLGGMPDEKDELIFYGATTLPEFAVQVGKLHKISVSCADFDSDGAIPIQIARDRDPSTLPVIIANSSTSPVLYVRPDIMAAGLLLRPLSEAQVAAMLRETLAAARAKECEQLFNNELFSFSTREGVIRIPYSQILYFEARNKKIVACTSRSETAFYATLENLTSVLPGYFLRCHKGFIVNQYLVERVDLSRNTLHLLNGFQVPVSRSYKMAVGEALT